MSLTQRFFCQQETKIKPKENVVHFCW